jgi:hypothetical protein
LAHSKGHQALLGAVDHIGLPLAHQKLKPLAAAAFAQALVLLDGDHAVPAVESRLVLAGQLPRVFLRVSGERVSAREWPGHYTDPQSCKAPQDLDNLISSRNSAAT